jgi:hypothetical protein
MPEIRLAGFPTRIVCGDTPLKSAIENACQLDILVKEAIIKP